MSQSDELSPDQDPLAFLAGGGEMGERIRSLDWSRTPLGPIARWPQSLRSALSLCLNSNFPIAIYWGGDLALLYNDAWSPIPGEKHPWALGRPAREAWAEIWDIIAPLFGQVMTTGEATRRRDQLLPMHRHGFTEECYFDYTFSPIRGGGGGVEGVLNVAVETTTRVIGERRLRTLRELAEHAAQVKTVEAACGVAAAFAGNPHDLPFALLYTLGGDGRATLASSAGLDRGTPASPAAIDPDGPDAPWPFRRVVETSRAVEVAGLADGYGPLPGGAWPEPAVKVVVLPVAKPGQDRLAGFVVAGVSPRLAFNDDYKGFLDLLAGHVATAIANARVYEEERRRAEELAELDRAKTAFFSNVSHEFRTPLTLMLGPVEELLARGPADLPPAAAGQLEVVNRNGLRLLRLVNSLLDFSRIEAGRVRAVFRPSDLAAYTADLASNFRSACERAGLQLAVDCPPLDEPAFVDREMWEKVVLNLLSNAFKFTFAGEIAVTLRRAGAAAELRVRDTGTGIPAGEMPRLFERFHRVENSRGRTHEGSGIGLALVQELIKLHGGSVAADSTVGQGTTFVVTVPLGSAHLPPDQIADAPPAASAGAGAIPYVEEALRWLPGEGPDEGRSERPPDHEPLPHRERAGGDERPRVLVADDNADMRQHVARLLAGQFRVVAVPDGEAALAAAREQPPDLVLTDVMMPKLSGFGLLKALRADPRTRELPVVMLSARAGEESRVEGVEAGADDYLVKPFSARELLARVTAHVQMARLRRAAGETVRASEERLRALVNASSDAVYRMNADWTEMRFLRGREFIADTHEADRTWLQKYIHPDDQPHVTSVIQQAVRTRSVFELEHRVLRVDGSVGWTFSRAVPLLDAGGAVAEWFGAATDVTARREADERLRASEERFRTLFDTMDEGFVVIEVEFDEAGRATDYRHVEANPAFERHTGLRDHLGKSVRQTVPGLEEFWFATYGRVAATGEPTRFEHRAGPLDGRWFDVYASRLGGPGGNRVAVLFTDITARKRAEAAVRESEGRLRTALTAARMVAWEWTPADGKLRVSENAADLFGLPAGAVLTGIDQGLALLHPDDVAAYRASFQKAIDDRAGYLTRYRLIRPDDGRVIWIEERGHTVFDLPGGSVRLYGVAMDVTDRHEAEADRERLLLQVKEERGRLADVFRQAPAFMCVLRGPAHVFEMANDRYFTLVGQRDILGKSVREAFPEVEEQGFIGLLDGVYRTGEPFIGTGVRLLLDQMGERYLDFVYQALRDPGGAVTGIVTVGVDVTARHRAEADLARLHAAAERERELFDTALSNTTDFNFIFGLDGRFVYANRSLLALWGRTAGEAIGRGMAELGYPPDVEAQLLGNIRRVVGTGQGVRDETPYTSPAGATGYYEYALAPVFDAGGAVVQVVGSARDIRDRKRTEEELRRLAGELREADRRKDEFLATLAHELRNPLAPIRNGLQVIRMAGANGTVEQARSMMERQLGQMVRLVDDLLDVSRVTTGKLELRRERVALKAVVAAAVETSRPAIEQAGHDFTVAVPDEPIWVDADATRLAQVVSNLLNNSAKYTHRGGHIALTVGRAGETAVVSVKDDGIGIPPAMLDKVFVMFTQVDRTLEKTTGGLGIGLSLVKGLVEMHGGTLEARSDGEGLGSEFVVTLPVAVPVAGAPDVSKEGAEEVVSSGRRRVLVVDDNVDAADSLAQLLEMLGNEVRTAYDGEAGVRAAGEFRPDVVLCDIGMPKLNGYEVCRRIRQQSWGRGMVLVALTGWGQDGDRCKTAEAGFDYHLVKPVEPATLMKLLTGLPATS